MKRLNLEFDQDLTDKLIKCKQCGNCCNGTIFKNTILMKKDIKLIENHFKMPIREIFELNEITKVHYCGKDFLAIKQPCKFYEDKTCIIYEDRPLVCRQFPINYSNGEIRVDESRCPAAKEFYENKKNEYEETIGENFNGN